MGNGCGNDSENAACNSVFKQFTTLPVTGLLFLGISIFAVGHTKFMEFDHQPIQASHFRCDYFPLTHGVPPPLYILFNFQVWIFIVIFFLLISG